MPSEGQGGSGIWTALAAIGGALSGVAAILALFVAKPDTIAVLIPQQALERAGLSAAPTSEHPTQQQAATPSASDAALPANNGAATTDAASIVPTTPAPTPSPSRALAPGVTVSLLSLVERNSQYIATFRFENGASQNVGVAVKFEGSSVADLVLTDGVGGSCQMIANGEGWGTLDSAELNPQFIGSTSPFRIVGAGASAQHTVFFNKNRCASDISPNPPSLAISGTLVVEASGARRAAPISFDSIQLRR